MVAFKTNEINIALKINVDCFKLKAGAVWFSIMFDTPISFLPHSLISAPFLPNSWPMCPRFLQMILYQALPSHKASKEYGTVK